VQDAGVFGVTDARWGQVPHAAVVLRPEQVVSTEALIDFCRERLARYKAPVKVTFVAALPRNAAGKLMRSELRATHS
jgi:acyl-CoA synthetase (AMP-forming)/AMP-acid ligase II